MVSMDMNAKKIIQLYKKAGARIETRGRVTLKNKNDLALWYTPGVGAASMYLAAHPEEARHLSIKKNSVAVISDGSAVLGLGNIGPYGALPVMEGKALIFRTMAGVDAWPIVLDTQDPDRIVETVLAIAPAFGGINLEDIKAPQCFQIEKQLIEKLNIPVLHDDQHGTAIVAAGIADLIVLDRAGALYAGREDMNIDKQELAGITNPHRIAGDLAHVLQDADAFIGLSGPRLLGAGEIERMAPHAIVFALSNPEPEIMPDEAKKGGAAVIGTGRSDFPNQINNALVFPGIFRGALDRGVRKITLETKLRAAKALAALVSVPTAGTILPDVFDPRVVPAVARAVR